MPRRDDLKKSLHLRGANAVVEFPNFLLDGGERAVGKKRKDAGQTLHTFGVQITDVWRACGQRFITDIIKLGNLCLKAKAQHPGTFGTLFDEKKVPFSHDTANKLMKVAQSKVIANSENSLKLPPHWYDLWRLETKLPNEVFQEMLNDGRIYPDITGKEISVLIEEYHAEGLYKIERWPEMWELQIKFMHHWEGRERELAAKLADAIYASDCNVLRKELKALLLEWLPNKLYPHLYPECDRYDTEVAANMRPGSRHEQQRLNRRNGQLKSKYRYAPRFTAEKTG